MTNQEILTKAIQKAIDGGHKFALTQNPEYIAADAIAHDAVPSIIFDHYFAKALWGEELERVWSCPKCDYSFEYTWHGESEDHCPRDGRKPKEVTRVKEYGDHPWQYHLQMMVISDDPIAYLGDNI